MTHETKAERERRRMRKVAFRKRILRWWQTYCLLIVAMLILLVGFLVGWHIRGWTSPMSVKPTVLTAAIPERVEVPVTQTQEAAPMEVFYYDVSLSDEEQDYIRALCDEHDVPMELVLAVIVKESRCDPDAVSDTGDYGLMQINHNNFKWLEEDYGITDFMDPYQNIYAGTMVLKGVLSIFETEEQAVIAYNRGPTGARNLFSNGVEHTEYSEDVMLIYQQLKTEAAPEAVTSEGGR